jgi:hypothetical protein
VTIGKVECAIYRPPAGMNFPSSAGCSLESKGYGFSLAIINPTVAVTPQQVKALSDKAVARLP